MFTNIVDRVPRHDRASVLFGAALGGKGRLPCAISVVVRCDLAAVWTVIGSLVRLMVMPHGLVVPETAESMSQHAC